MTRAAGEMQAKVDAAATSAQTFGLTQCGAGLKPAVANLFEGTKSVVKTSYVAKAEGLCRDAYRKLDTIAEPSATMTEPPAARACRRRSPPCSRAAGPC